MTTTTEGTTTDDVDQPEGGPADTDDTNPETPPKGNREAKYRVERNAAREALTAAESRIEALQTREVERLAAELAQPSDIFSMGGVSLADLLNEDGDVDPEAVSEAVAALLEQRPGLAKTPSMGAYDPTQGQSGGQGKPELKWNSLFDR